MNDGNNNHTATLTIVEPTLNTYAGTGTAAATLTGMTMSDTEIKYVGRDGTTYEESTTAPTNAGKYTAKITVEGETASVDYEIAQAGTTITEIPTASEITYGQTLADSVLTGGTASKEGAFAWKDSNVAPAVADSQTKEYDVVFMPTDVNYGTVECTVKLAVNRANSAVTKAPEAKALTYNGQAQELVTAGEATGGEIQYALGTESEATEPYTATIPTATDAGTYHVWYKVVGDENHLDSEPARVEATIEPAASQDIAKVLSANVTLSGDLVMNYYLSVPDDIASGATAVMEGPEGEKRVDLSSLSKDGEGRYEVNYAVMAIRADQSIALRLEDANGAAIELHGSNDTRLDDDVLTYGLYDYFGAALADDSPLNDAWKARIRATYTYCAYAVRWKYGTELPAGVNALPDITAQTEDVVAHKATQEGTAPDGVAVTGVSLLLDSSTSLRLYFTCDDIAKLAVKLDNQAVEPVLLSGNKYYVQVSSIGVKNLEKTFTVTFGGGYSVKLDALSYVSGALGDDSLGEPLKDAVRAFYAYDKAYKA